MIVLDTSAVLAVILGEPGAHIVSASIAEASISAVNYAEVYQFAARGSHPLSAFDLFFEESFINIIDLSRDVARRAGFMVTETRSAGLSLGDRCCLALAIHHQAEVLTADRVWESFAILLGVQIRLIR